MPSEDNHAYVSELHRAAVDIAFQLAQAISGYELYSSTIKGDHWRQISALGLNRSASAVSGLLRSNTILAIGRIWDKDPRSNSVDRILRLLDSPIVLRMFGPKSEHKTFSVEKLADFQARAQAMRDNPQFKSLEHVRNKRVAHNDVFDPKKEVPEDFRPMVLDDDIAVLNLTAPLLIEAAATFRCTLLSLNELRQFWNVKAAKFWSGLGSSPADQAATVPSEG